MSNSQRMIDELSCNMDRDKINKERLEDIKGLIHHINNKKDYRDSFFNKLLSKIGVKYQVKEEVCFEGVYTDFDYDEEFMNGLKSLLEQREQRIINHAQKFIIKQED